MQVYASVCLFMYANEDRWVIFTCFLPCVGVCLHVYEGVCSWKCVCVVGVGVFISVIIELRPLLLTLFFNILLGDCDEYLTLICSREQRMFINVGWGR